MKCKGLYMKCKTSVDMILIIWFNTINIKNQPERDVSEWQDQKKMTSENLMVIKSNDLIRKKKSALSARQQKIVLYLIAQIEPHDDDFKEYEFKMRIFVICAALDAVGKPIKRCGKR